MFSLSVRDHTMIAHSFASQTFGPAQRLHGATYVVTATFFAQQLDDDNLVIDIGVANRLLRESLSQLDYQNLDDLAAFEGALTTTEFLCAWLHRQMASQLVDTDVVELQLELKESHVAWASYRAPVG